MVEITKLCRMIPPDVVRRVLDPRSTELDPTFMGFEDVYFAIAKHLDKDMIVVDCGCNQAPQCYIFKDHPMYIGVDCFDKRAERMPGVPMPERFQTPNTMHVRQTIDEFLHSNMFRHLDLDETYFIASFVPDFEQVQELFEKVPNAAMYYCGDIRTKGYKAAEIADELKKLRRKE